MINSACTPIASSKKNVISRSGRSGSRGVTKYQCPSTIPIETAPTTSPPTTNASSVPTYPHVGSAKT